MIGALKIVAAGVAMFVVLVLAYFLLLSPA